MNHNYVWFFFTKKMRKKCLSRFLEPEIWYQTLLITISYSNITKTIRLSLELLRKKNYKNKNRF